MMMMKRVGKSICVGGAVAAPEAVAATKQLQIGKSIGVGGALAAPEAVAAIKLQAEAGDTSSGNITLFDFVGFSSISIDIGGFC